MDAAASRSSRGFEDEDDDELEFGRREGPSHKDLTIKVDGKGSGTDDLPTTPKSKHSAMEQRRRNKINDRKIATALMAIMRSKSMKSSKLIMLRLLRNKKVLMSALLNKLQPVIGDQRVLLMDVAKEEVSVLNFVEDDNDYPDLRHSLFELNDDTGGSVTDWVRNCRGDDESEVILEDEIDHVADIFIRWFHRHMRLEEESISWY